MPAEWPAGQRERIRDSWSAESNWRSDGRAGGEEEKRDLEGEDLFLDGAGTVSRREGSAATSESQDLW